VNMLAIGQKDLELLDPQIHVQPYFTKILYSYNNQLSITLNEVKT